MDYKRLTIDYPQDNYEMMLNLTLVKDKEVFIRCLDDGEDVSLVGYCKELCKETCNVDLDGSAETFGEYMECNCEVSILYWMAVGHAELRERLKQYEDSGLSPKEVKELKQNAN